MNAADPRIAANRSVSDEWAATSGFTGGLT